MSELTDQGFRLSPCQRAIATTALRAPRPVWVQAVVLLEGRVDPASVRGAVSAVVTRHEALRTTFRALPGTMGLVQVVHEPGDDVWAWTQDDLWGEAPAGVDRLRDHERTGLDMEHGPVFRAALARERADRSWLVLTAHPLVADRASLRVVCADLARMLRGETEPPPPVQYADYANWHDELLGDEAHEADRAFWSGLLRRGVAGALDERWLGAAGAAAGTRGTAPVEVPAALDSRAAAQDLDVEALALTVWRLLLQRLRGGDSATVWVACDGRGFEELQLAVGPFARMLPIEAAQDPALTVRQAVTATARELAAAREHADHLAPELLAADRLPPVGFVSALPPPCHQAGAVLLRMVEESGDGESPVLALRLGPGPRLALDHAAGLAEAPALARACAALLAAALDDPDAPLASLTSIAPADRAAALARGDGPAVPYPASTPFHQLFAHQARRTPDRLAVSCGETSLTYAELAARAHQLARHLRALGVGHDDAVVLSMDRCVDLPVAVVGILAAGATYVPVDPRQPAERLRFVLEETRATAVVSATPLPLDTGCPNVALERDRGAIAALAPSPPGALAASSAYVMYTSGTTGRPNGVMVSQRGLVNYLAWCAEAYRLRDGAGAVVATSIGFDLTVTALLAPLLVGQRVVLVPDAAGMAGLAALLQQDGDVSLLKLTPTHLQVLAQLLPAGGPSARVRTLVVGGEELRAEHLAPFLAAPRPPRVVNEYGPTETVVGSTAHVLPAAPPAGRVPIGRPVHNTRAHLLDGDLEPVGEALPGELYLGGEGVAHGYLARPALTAERFVPDPHGSAPGARLYRTGDRARRLPSGDLDFLGRLDDQVKIRGVRVEPGEVTAVLTDHPGVRQACVVARRVDGGGRSSPLAGEDRLVAYVVPEGEAPRADDLAAHCRERLPDALVPSAFVALDALPLTVGGKFDRDALPAPEAAPRRAPYVAPRTPTEETIAGAAMAVLGLDRVGIDDDYHVLGGDSIRSVMIASRAQARGVDLRVADLHAHPTVRACAALVDSRNGGGEAPRTEPFSLVSAEDRARMPADVEDAFPLNLLQEGMIFHRDFAAKSAVYHAIASVRLRAPLHLDVLRMVVRRLVERHPMLRTSFDQTSFSQPLQLVHRTFADPLRYEDLRGLAPAEQDARVLAWVDGERERGFELDEYPLIRFMAQRLDDDTFQFTYGFHHEIVDGWSEALMVTELFTHYFSVVFDEPVVLRAPSATMRDAVALERQALATQEHFDFWSGYLADATLMRLPRLASAPQADKGAREIVRLAVPVPEELSDRLGRLALSLAVPLKSVLLAAHVRVMSHFGGGRDTLTYTVTNGRPETGDGSTAIGLFVNSLALRVRLDGGSWRDLVLDTLRSEQASMPHRRLPMAELKRHRGSEPLAETLFFFTDYHVFSVLDRWKDRGVEHVADELYGESTFPFCAIFRRNRDSGLLEIRLEYDSLQFTAELMDRLAGCYARVLDAMTDDPDARYHTQPLLSGTQERQLLAEWARSEEPPRAGGSLHRLVEEQARARPHAVAVLAADGALTYAELDARADRLARRLQGCGVGPERFVGVLADASAAAVTGILAVLKAGGAYVPLDPGQPAARLDAIARDAGLHVVLAGAATTWRPGGDVAVIGLDEAGHGPPATPPPGEWHDACAAYAIYTSGSTGSPKGVVVEHRHAVASTLARTRHYADHPERFLMLSPLSFDSSIAGLFWTLASGGTLLVPPGDVLLDPLRLGAFAARHRPTHTLGIPSLLAQLVAQAAGDDLSSLRVAIAAGEACPRELWAAMAEAAPGARLWNEYGPTEVSVWSTAYGGDPVDFRPALPIGRPTGGVEAYVVDDHGLPLPVGVSGELLLGGTRLARGYLGRPSATAERFVPAGPGHRAGARLYRSGDLARWLPSGDLEFLDRIDNQVKVRGFRVELAEVEAVLDEHPGVARCIVVAPAEGDGGRTLAAYVVPEAGAVLDPDTVTRYVRERLPKYMVPASVTLLDSLPLTSTGKVDRGALPRPERAAAATSSPPGTQTEVLVAAIWRQALRVEAPGLGDDFFELGGDSLRAMQVTTQTNKHFDVRLSVRALFDAPTLAAYAARVERERGAQPADVAAAPAVSGAT